MIETGEGLSHIAGRYMTFTLAGEQYGISILKVLEIFGMMNVTTVPRCPNYLKGVINLRGKIIPVVDLRTKFGLPEKATDRDTCIIVVNATFTEEDIAIGLIVDSVLEVCDYEENTLSSAPVYGASLDTRFVLAMGKGRSEDVSVLLDIDVLFHDDESELLTRSSE
ncbi:MAG: purine-binding chemotaxis protein CheW [Bdellovibrionales bacterium]|nr:purine-binding chemotaxis protein CheW [Bdellovibrionales bacterium]